MSDVPEETCTREMKRIGVKLNGDFIYNPYLYGLLIRKGIQEMTFFINNIVLTYV